MQLAKTPLNAVVPLSEGPADGWPEVSDLDYGDIRSRILHHLLPEQVPKYSGTPHNGHPSTTATLDITAKSSGPD